MTNPELQQTHTRLSREVAALKVQAEQIAKEIAAKEEAIEHLKDHAAAAPKPEATK